MTEPNADAQYNQSRPRFPFSTVVPSSIYKFSHVFPPATHQSEFFEKTTLPLVRDLLDGQNGLLFTYGVTNSGKTYTVQGGNEPGSAGILPRALDAIFNSIEGLHNDGRLDRNYEYSIWLSYAEVYNEKVYDLLASVNDGVHGNAATLTVKPSPPTDSLDDATWGSSGKYIAGLRQFRTTSASQAKSLVKLGQLHRRVFGTLANSQSSRSHGLVTLRVVRGHRGERDDPTSLQISRLTLVDLAGSERTKHTQTTGDRLKEAGNINKSLMVLGQCMEVMKANQKRVAQSLTNAGRTDTRDVKKGLAVVPFRHSKLTEVLMDYFTGDGKVVMIVNVNPYDTGFDENSHVMKFSALTREVYTTMNNAPIPRIPASPTKRSAAVPGNSDRSWASGLPKATTRKVTISSIGPGRKISEAQLEVLEEDEEAGEADYDPNDDDEPINPLVDALFDEVEELRLRLYEAEMRCAIIEADTREEVMKEMDERMRAMENMYTRRLMTEVEQNEMKMDAKIDMLQRSGLLTGARPFTMSNSRLSDPDESEEDEGGELIDIDISDDERADADDPPSPLEGKKSSKH
ncbi:hypothetical protein SERLADRAFT_359061 [Serpula lacrymans var. lacrymans S7.9]|uniref:Kinesin-like protein n=1 Tax=Serpula lacrymans var. lacrymans (strain S7.9) TaxID=578457 RepID=F8NFV6_SERL9|nr:uncharacterized protein SERLADRAFT_359061 [Serpula lacrymans var. lacrymans S7.9]EGO30926.1 hypothetical protein SERLADRAFT_359061 [Serpula lacrymans var. lacrymans S7.9]